MLMTQQRRIRCLNDLNRAFQGRAKWEVYGNDEAPLGDVVIAPEEMRALTRVWVPFYIEDLSHQLFNEGKRVG